MDTNVDKALEGIKEEIINFRRDFHKYPEAAWGEFRTASLIIKRLKELDFEVLYGKDIINEKYRMNLPSKKELKQNYKRALEQGGIPEFMEKMKGGFTAVCGILKNGEGPTIALRFDIDAVKNNECEEEDHKPFKFGFSSVNKGIMHGCGHDGHISIGLGVSEIISKFKNFKGTIKIIFQAAEEGVSGARSIAESGVLDDVDYIVSGHIGIKARKSGEIICGTDGFFATSKINAEFKGKSAHAGVAPEKGHNALLSASTAVLNLDAIPRNSEGVTRINVGKLVAGSGRNVVPGRAFMEIETRGETTELNKYMEDYANRILESSAMMHDTDVEIKCVGKSINADSDKELIDFAVNIAKNMKEFDKVIKKASFGASEDICYMMKRVQDNGGKALYMMFGTELKGEHHSVRFDFNEEDMFKAIKTYLNIVDELSKNYKKIS